MRCLLYFVSVREHIRANASSCSPATACEIRLCINQSILFMTNVSFANCFCNYFLHISFFMSNADGINKRLHGTGGDCFKVKRQKFRSCSRESLALSVHLRFPNALNDVQTLCQGRWQWACESRAFRNTLFVHMEVPYCGQAFHT